jgi:hypothetical protein
MDGPIRWYMMPIKLPRTIARKPDGMNILVAIEPRAYREVIGETIGALRPQHKVTVVAPGSLRPALDRLGPEVVISGRSDGFMANGTLAYARPEARVSLKGLRRELAEVDLEDLLAVVDEAGALSGG